MARVVTDIISLINPQGQVVKSAEMSDEGLSLLNTQLMIDYVNKDLDSIMIDIFFYDDVINYVNHTNIKDKFKNFDKFNEEFNSIFKKIQEMYPHKYNNRLKEYKKYSCSFIFALHVVGSFIDNKYDLISCINNRDEEHFSALNIPLVPEAAERLYEITLYTIKKYSDVEKEVRNIIFKLYVAKAFFYEYVDRYPNEDVVYKIKDIESRLNDLKSEYPNEYMYIVNNFSYQIKKHRGVCTLPSHFSIYLLNKLLKEKDMESLLTLNEIIFKSVDLDYIDETGYSKLFEKLSGFIASLGLTDEYYCFIDMKKYYSETELVNIFATYLDNFQNSVEYQKLKDEYYGYGRTQE